VCGREAELVTSDYWTFSKGVRVKVEDVQAKECECGDFELTSVGKERLRNELNKHKNDVREFKIV
jgi:hypothetical protein